MNRKKIFNAFLICIVLGTLIVILKETYYRPIPTEVTRKYEHVLMELVDKKILPSNRIVLTVQQPGVQAIYDVYTYSNECANAESVQLGYEFYAVIAHDINGGSFVYDMSNLCVAEDTKHE